MSIAYRSSFFRYSLGVATALGFASACDSNDPVTDTTNATGGLPATGGSSVGGTTSAGSGGTAAGAGGSGATGGSGGLGGASGSTQTGGTGGTSGTDSGGEGGSGGDDGDCGNVMGEGVVVYEDVTESTTWSCPRYTLTRPTFVRGTATERTMLTIAAGVTVAGVAGDLDALKLPGALIVTRSGRLEAVGRADAPIVFTSAQPTGARAPGDWGGVVLLGRASTNVPANFENSGNQAGEMFIEGLPKTELATYGRPHEDDGGGGAGGGGGEGGGGSGDDPGLDWDCGHLEYVRIEFAGFEVAPTRELNGLTMGACGRDTIIDRVQVHLGSDDGIEIFGGAVDIQHVVMTGAKDDSLDWDQGWRGRAQFVAIQMHDDAALPPEDKGDSGIEADGYADPVLRFGSPSSPRISNMTLIASVTSQRGMRLRDGTQATFRNSLVLAPTGGVASGLVDIGDVITADWITAGRLSLSNTAFSGAWPVSGQMDSQGTLYTEADYFTTGAGSTGNDVLAAPTVVLPNAFNQTSPGWVPASSSAAAMHAVAPEDRPGEPAFFDTAAVYRGAFAPGGDDWTSGWTAYPTQ